MQEILEIVAPVQVDSDKRDHLLARSTWTEVKARFGLIGVVLFSATIAVLLFRLAFDNPSQSSLSFGWAQGFVLCVQYAVAFPLWQFANPNGYASIPQRLHVVVALGCLTAGVLFPLLEAHYLNVDLTTWDTPYDQSASYRVVYALHVVVRWSIHFIFFPLYFTGALELRGLRTVLGCKVSSSSTVSSVPVQHGGGGDQSITGVPIGAVGTGASHQAVAASDEDVTVTVVGEPIQHPRVPHSAEDDKQDGTAITATTIGSIDARDLVTMQDVWAANTKRYTVVTVKRRTVAAAVSGRSHTHSLAVRKTEAIRALALSSSASASSVGLQQSDQQQEEQSSRRRKRTPQQHHHVWMVIVAWVVLVFLAFLVPVLVGWRATLTKTVVFLLINLTCVPFFLWDGMFENVPERIPEPHFAYAVFFAMTVVGGPEAVAGLVLEAFKAVGGTDDGLGQFFVLATLSVLSIFLHRVLLRVAKANYGTDAGIALAFGPQIFLELFQVLLFLSVKEVGVLLSLVLFNSVKNVLRDSGHLKDVLLYCRTKAAAACMCTNTNTNTPVAAPHTDQEQSSRGVDLEEAARTYEELKRLSDQSQVLQLCSTLFIPWLILCALIFSPVGEDVVFLDVDSTERDNVLVAFAVRLVAYWLEVRVTDVLLLRRFDQFVQQLVLDGRTSIALLRTDWLNTVYFFVFFGAWVTAQCIREVAFFKVVRGLG